MRNATINNLNAPDLWTDVGGLWENFVIANSSHLRLREDQDQQSPELIPAYFLFIHVRKKIAVNDCAISNLHLIFTDFLLLDIHYSLHYSNFVRKYFVEGRIMQSVITSKFQTTIPKAIREDIGLSVKDALNWKVEKGEIIVSPSKRSFLKYRNVIKTGRGDIAADIETARNLRAEKHR